MSSFFALFTTGFAGEVFRSMFTFAPVWVPIALILIWWDVYFHERRRDWIQKQGGLLLEIKIPSEMFKSPQAMELFLNSLNQAGVGSLLDVYIKGRLRSWFSLELVSIDGVVHFYIWTHPKHRPVLESQLYAVFPNIEIHEAPDYSLGIHRNPEKLSIGWIGQFALTKADAYPIRTYIDYGLDKDPKEEYKNDPIAPMIEWLGSLKKGEQAWFQILIQAHGKEGLKQGRLIERPDWKKAVEKEIKEILKKGRLKPDDDKTQDSTKHLTQAQKETIEAIERTAAKPAFDTMIRGAYIAEKNVFNPNNIGGLLGCFKAFGHGDMNGFKPDFNAGKYDYPWQDPGGRQKAKWEKELLEAYKRRSFFNPPFKYYHGKPFILTTEELATMWHFPSSQAVATPTLTRIPSKKAEAPANLPI